MLITSPAKRLASDDCAAAARWGTPVAAAAHARAAPPTRVDGEPGARRIHIGHLPSTGRAGGPRCNPSPHPYPDGPVRINVAAETGSGLGTACEVGADE